MENMRKEEVNIIMCDLKVKIVKGTAERTIGEYELGIINARGKQLIRFCQ